MILKNKKADISITILVLGVVALSFLTILSFANQNNKIGNSFAGIGLIETVKSIAEENNFYSSSEFRSDYGTKFEKGKVKIEIKGNEIDGNYAKEGKVLARVIYKR